MIQTKELIVHCCYSYTRRLYGKNKCDFTVVFISSKPLLKQFFKINSRYIDSIIINFILPFFPFNMGWSRDKWIIMHIIENDVYHFHGTFRSRTIAFAVICSTKYKSVQFHLYFSYQSSATKHGMITKMRSSMHKSGLIFANYWT